MSEVNNSGVARNESLSVEETNKLRISLGLKPIPIPTKNNLVSKDIGLETRLEAVKKENESVDGKPHFIANDKINLLRRRLTNIKNNIGKVTLLDEQERKTDPTGDEDWLPKIGQRKKSGGAALKKKQRVALSYEHEEEDDESGANFPIMKLAHNISDIKAGKDIILTLKESNILDDDDRGSEDEAGDMLENESLRQEKEDLKNLELRQMNKERRRKKIALTIGSRAIEDDEMNQKDIEGKSTLVIGAKNNINSEKPISFTNSSNKLKVVLPSDEEESDIGDFKPAKIRKRSKKQDSKILNKRKKISIHHAIKNVELTDEEENDNSLDSLDTLAPTLKKGKSKSETADLSSRKITPEDIALQIRKEKFEEEERSKGIDRLRKAAASPRIVIDESTVFLESLGSTLPTTTETDTIPKSHIEKTSNELVRRDENAEISAEGNENNFVVQEPNFTDGLASTLQFLQTRGVFEDIKAKDNHSSSSNKVDDQTLKVRRSMTVEEVHQSIEETVKKNKQKYPARGLERDALQDYNPSISLIYKDKEGNELTTKEAYKRLSQKFHGTKSNEKKLAKAREKIKARNRQNNANNTFGFI
ncbi:U4/U6-U5 snRNP complex subunit SNU66 NDAI_0E00560 [Naumovozyma dairenensis CBS 421]|uniref:Uncharacterized protein n=1 Tax=Naumovozyma dairenensis (strain ATCC 10597 / BCRC 20456 / CBS 421 / NBRC 0211 / NRRL Y-12639) TaxID=1071378 RepID=G0WAV2_NAUDC|nr:hypothetical protein NDAI_0E00560 [Naumovozyma dairenensis CBS 421]CCD24872.1 hypothetical protein NDAI_0E00560 [Naumovozyma dairenensis CBS 421]